MTLVPSTVTAGSGVAPGREATDTPVASATASAWAGRSVADLARQASMISRRSSGTVAGSSGRGSVTWAMAVATGDPMSNGLRPVTISCATIPRE